jgi:hypothetical protein
VVLSAFVIYACSSREDFQIRSESTTIAQFEEGDDWSLPSWVAKKEGTGLPFAAESPASVTPRISLLRGVQATMPARHNVGKARVANES